jgi:tetratricopeptide (TPR) repeat protein
MISTLLDMLGAYYQAGNLEQMEAIARTLLSAIPDDVVALQFLALALHQRGRIRDAYAFLRQAVERQENPAAETSRYPTTGEPAAVACYREATRFGSRLAGGWYQISRLLAHYGFKEQAERAFRSARAASRDRRLTLRSEDA